jgi:hypothetical protein
MKKKLKFNKEEDKGFCGFRSQIVEYSNFAG